MGSFSLSLINAVMFHHRASATDSISHGLHPLKLSVKINLIYLSVDHLVYFNTLTQVQLNPTVY